MTELFRIDPYKIDQSTIETAAALLRQGETVAFPTETVYGLGANALDPVAVQKIFAAKGRPSDNPLIVHIADSSELTGIARTIPLKASLLMEHFWPGPLTLIFPKAEGVPDAVTAGLNTVAIRMPDHPVALALIKASGVPVAAPSANSSGRPSPTRAEHVVEDLWGKVAAIINAGSCRVGLESTVLDLTVDPPMILRPGGITREQLEAVMGEKVKTDPGIERVPSPKSQAPSGRDLEVGDSSANSRQRSDGDGPSCRGRACSAQSDPVPSESTGDEGLGTRDLTSPTPRSPGMKYTHYAPKAPMTLFVGPRDHVVGAIAEQASATSKQGCKVGVLLTTSVAFMPGDVVITLGDDAGQRPKAKGQRGRGEEPSVISHLPAEGQELCSDDACWLRANPYKQWLHSNQVHDPDEYTNEALEAIANGIYDALRQFDEAGVDIILAQGVPSQGLGQAIMNRLSKAAGGNVVAI